MKKTVITTAAALAATLGFVLFSVGAARTSGVPGPQAQHSHHDCDHSNHDTAHHDCAEHGTVSVAEHSSVTVAAAPRCPTCNSKDSRTLGAYSTPKCGACRGKGGYYEKVTVTCSACRGEGRIKGIT
ncbi:MAG: hypothetical protein LBB40_02445, partial [Holophagales bacterium]|nr:hypothetical protein [Holophagales bacterium]